MTHPPSETQPQRDWHRLTEEFAEESDRASALVAAALLDRNLEDLLRVAMIEDDNQVDLLLATGLRNLIARTRACYCLGLISEDERNDLRLINEIRNTFAHDLHVSFDDPALVSRCARLRLIRRILHQDKVAPRAALEQTACMLSVLLVRRLDEAESKRASARPEMTRLDLQGQCALLDDPAGESAAFQQPRPVQES